MYRYFLIFTAIGVFATSSVLAGQKIKHGSNNMCYYITDTGSKKNGDNWTYYYCGQQSATCDGKKSKGHDKVVWQYNSDHFEHNGTKYWCCGGTAEKSGTYVSGEDWIANTRVKETIPVGNGTCDVKIATDICGNEEEIKCNTPGTCNTGYTMRNGECAAECSDGQAFESATSNKCVDIKNNNYQGVSTGTDKTIIKCDEDTQFFDKSTKKCIAKSTLKQISKDTMKKCWRCPDDETFVKCVGIVQRPLEQLNFADKTESGTLKRCHIDKNSLKKITNKD